MSKTFVFRTLKDEIRRFWLVRPPERRTFADTDAFAHSLWHMNLQAGSHFEKHRGHVEAVVTRSLGSSSNIPTLDQVVVPCDGDVFKKIRLRYL